MREHGVSRTVVRKALSKLQASGLLEAWHGIGTFVITRRPQTGFHLGMKTAASVRQVLRCTLAWKGRPPLRRTDEHLRRMREALDGYQDSGDSDAARATVRLYWDQQPELPGQ
ncbi:FadR family transcriptional regulator [Pseudomonas guariconensis]|nr:FadR family transcriptional regulator [Pseudomonas guariconensis]MBF8750199.1 FadR family transcriptional regulator [Pseudomonas guariconensis]